MSKLILRIYCVCITPHRSEDKVKEIARMIEDWIKQYE